MLNCKQEQAVTTKQHVFLSSHTTRGHCFQTSGACGFVFLFGTVTSQLINTPVHPTQLLPLLFYIEIQTHIFHYCCSFIWHLHKDTGNIKILVSSGILPRVAPAWCLMLPRTDSRLTMTLYTIMGWRMDGTDELIYAFSEARKRIWEALKAPLTCVRAL